MYRIRAVMAAVILTTTLLFTAMPAHAASGACPNTLRGRVTVQAIHRYFPPSRWRWAESVARRESNCGQVLHAYRASTHDDSFGPFMLNRWGANDRMWSRWGFTRASMNSVVGGTLAAAFLYYKCGIGPWVRPYSCRR